MNNFTGGYIIHVDPKYVLPVDLSVPPSTPSADVYRNGSVLREYYQLHKETVTVDVRALQRCNVIRDYDDRIAQELRDIMLVCS